MNPTESEIYFPELIIIYEIIILLRHNLKIQIIRVFNNNNLINKIKYRLLLINWHQII